MESLLKFISPDLFENTITQIVFFVFAAILFLISFWKKIADFNDEISSKKLNKAIAYLEKFSDDFDGKKILEEYRNQEIFYLTVGFSASPKQRTELEDWIFNKRISIKLISYAWEYIDDTSGSYEVKIGVFSKIYAWINFSFMTISFFFGTLILINTIYLWDFFNNSMLPLMSLFFIVAITSAWQLRSYYAAVRLQKKLREITC